MSTDLTDRCKRNVNMFGEGMARLWLNDIYWKPNVATFRLKEIYHESCEMDVSDISILMKVFQI